jgi:imidazoleglycerol phosphate dehydratase HisB
MPLYFKKEIDMSKFWLQIQLFFFGNVDKILDNFNAVNRKLDKAVEMHEARAQAALDAQARQKAIEDAARASAAKAQTASTNIKALLGG